MVDHDAPEEVAKREDQVDPLVMYLVVRQELNMSMGKTAAQCSHAAQMILLRYFENGEMEVPKMKLWLDGSFRKVVLRADEKEWIKLKELMDEVDGKVIVIDAGLTELNPHTETVIGFYPMYKSQRPKIIKRLQVLK